jgi:DNA-binding LytR/AlgR family response regulator
MTAPEGLRLLVADDEQLALDELVSLLRADPRVASIITAASGSEALRLLSTEHVDAALLDIHMPGLSGLELAQAVLRFERRPPVVFVTADHERAVDAFELEAVDYLLKPVRVERLERAISRLVGVVTGQAGTGEAVAAVSSATPATIAVTLGSTTRLVRRDAIQYVLAQGDYARLHTADASFLVRVPLSDLESQWHDAGFVRVHRSYLVALDHVTRMHLGAPSPTVTVGETTLPVSRRLLPALRDQLERRRVRPRS